uniref:OSK domain-containing protein n=1 Tax=Graphocephala atropunctata TaxID=36148 RepID=A0A1B6MNB7_9HEMI
MEKARNNSIGEINKRVKVVVECYRNVECHRVVHSPFGPIVKSNVRPARCYWVPEPVPVQYIYRPVPVAQPYMSVHGPAWYPNNPRCDEFGNQNCTSSTSSPRPISTSTPREGVSYRNQNTSVQRKPIAITNPADPHQSQSIKRENEEDKERKSNSPDKEPPQSKSTPVIDRTTNNKTHIKSEDYNKLYQIKKTKTRHRKQKKEVKKDSNVQTYKLYKNDKSNNLSTKGGSSECSKVNDKPSDTPTRPSSSYVKNVSEEEILKENNELCVRIVEDILKDDMEWTIIDSVDEDIIDSPYNQGASKNGECDEMQDPKNFEMSTLNSDGVKSTNSNQINTPQSNFKKSFEQEFITPTQTKLSSSIRFTPPQLYKNKKTVQNSGSSERNSPKECSPKNLKLEGPTSSAVSTPVSTSPTSSTSKSRTPITWDKTSPTSSSQVRSSTSGSRSENLSNRTLDTSSYITPENTPKSQERSRFKRSLSDYFEDNQSAHESSQNSSAYYTPDSSPGEYGSSVKRFKTRWSDTSTSFSRDSRYSNGRVCPVKSEYEPALIGYQLIGDSQFCRFGQQLLGLQRVPAPNSPGRIGICVSGQTITDLHRRVKEKFYPISDKIILMIGTNDFLRNVDVTTMCKELTALVETLLETVDNIVLLTLPPIPKLERKHSSQHFALLDKYNSHIRSLENGDSVRIADISPLYMSCPPYQKCRMHLFELFFSGPARKPDLIHLNRLGLELIRKYILENLL